MSDRVSCKRAVALDATQGCERVYERRQAAGLPTMLFAPLAAQGAQSAPRVLQRVPQRDRELPLSDGVLGRKLVQVSEQPDHRGDAVDGVQAVDFVRGFGRVEERVSEPGARAGCK